MTMFQLLMLGGSAYFAYQIYKHIQTLEEPEKKVQDDAVDTDVRTVKAFSTSSAKELVDKADVEFENKDLKKALALLREADQKEPHNADTIYKMAYILQQTSSSEEALNLYLEASELDPTNEYIHNAIASIYRKDGKYESAKKHLQKSLDIESSNYLTYFNFGNLLVDMGQKDEALKMYEKALQLEPSAQNIKDEIEKLKKDLYR